jgi:hypothetical protein
MRGPECTAALAIAVLAAVLSVAADSRADAASEAVARALGSLDYDANASCPDRAAFVARVAARTRAVQSEPRRVSVRIDVQPQRVRGEIAIEDSGGARTARQIEAATCAEAVDALALITALALGGDGTGTGTGTGSASGSASESDSDSGSDSDSASDPDSESGSASDSAAEPATAPPADSRASADDDVDASDPLDPAAGDPSAAGGLQLSAAVLALSGAAPDVQPAGQLVVAWVAAPSAPFVLALRAGVRLGAGARIEHAQGSAVLDFVSAVAAGCAGARLARATLNAYGCAVLEPGQLSARGDDTDNPRDEDRLWLALGPGALLEWTPGGPWLLEAGAELQFPLRRDRFLLARQTVYRVPSSAFRATLGVGLRF